MISLFFFFEERDILVVFSDWNTKAGCRRKTLLWTKTLLTCSSNEVASHWASFRWCFLMQESYDDLENIGPVVVQPMKPTHRTLPPPPPSSIQVKTNNCTYLCKYVWEWYQTILFVCIIMIIILTYNTISQPYGTLIHTQHNISFSFNLLWSIGPQQHNIQMCYL